MKMLNYSEASNLIGVPIGTLYAWVSQKRIPHVRLGRRLVRFREQEIHEWIERHRVAPTVVHENVETGR